MRKEMRSRVVLREIIVIYSVMADDRKQFS